MLRKISRARNSVTISEALPDLIIGTVKNFIAVKEAGEN